MSDPFLLQGHALCKTYQSGDETITVLREVDLVVQAGEMTAIVGASGSGKTTLLQILGTLDAPDSGRLFFQGIDLSGRSEPDLAAHRNRHIGFIFQFHHLLPEFTALENVMMPGLNGVAELKKYMETLPPAPVVVVSGSRQRSTIRAAIEEVWP